MDGSKQSYEMVNYISRAYVLWQRKSFSSMSSTCAGFILDWEKDPLGPQYITYLKDWENKKEGQILAFMEKGPPSPDSSRPGQRGGDKDQDPEAPDRHCA